MSEIKVSSTNESKSNWMLIVGVVLIVSAAVIAVFQNRESLGLAGSYKEVDWRDLSELDFVTGDLSAKLKALDNMDVKIPGFMVPLEDESRKVTEWLLVPTPQACIHVPPPPPNQMVRIFMNKGADVAFGPIWIYGKLKLRSSRSIYGESSFTMEGQKIEPYK
jgi:uncharacterized protein